MANSYLIEVSDQTETNIVDTELLISAVTKSLERFKIPKAVFSIGIVDGTEMQSLNNQYLGHDYDTDVLSFCLHDPEQLSDEEGLSGPEDGQSEFQDPADQRCETEQEVEYDPDQMLPEGEEFGFDSLQGQLIVSLDYAQKQSEELDVKLNEELALYVVHGSLHVLGFDDHTPEDRTEMRKLEIEILSRMDIVPCWPESGNDQVTGA